jgi:peptide deformylase
MALLSILQYPDARLKLVAKHVDSFDAALENFCADMLETMYKSNGVGLAATQVNVQQRIFTLDISSTLKQPMCIINPKILDRSGNVVWEEGCLSFPGVYAKVTRSAALTLEYCNIKGEPQTMQAEGLLAICIQHELDHLNGITFFDHLSSLKKRMLRNKLEKIRERAT